MRSLVLALMCELLGMAPLSCATDQAKQMCAQFSIRANVSVDHDGLNLADLLDSGSCAPLRTLAEHVELGSAPPEGKVRVMEGSEIRQFLKPIEARLGAGKALNFDIPDQITVQRTKRIKSCEEIARFVSHYEKPGSSAMGRQSSPVDCTAARSVPLSALLELVKNSWDPLLRRREFVLRCASAQDCLPFLVWKRETFPTELSANVEHRARFNQPSSGQKLVKPGQTAILTWDQDGIRVTLPVTCLESGTLGQQVRVRMQNAPHILHAEVVGAGALRASL